MGKARAMGTTSPRLDGRVDLGTQLVSTEPQPHARNLAKLPKESNYLLASRSESLHSRHTRTVSCRLDLSRLSALAARPRKSRLGPSATSTNRPPSRPTSIPRRAGFDVSPMIPGPAHDA
ncbi:hypothetical protein HBH53_000580 [Parastagonospora nodorum]|nr:hypothetical protein HBH53_000580 [Parastagonospora nodorum]KAH4420272.1 hypothetical protein HBH92_031930 [Parastagonospora nodorum]KAH4452639.1 hypothetical protein HBH93_029420 [Parastagonospora nodorum]KAH4466153.1 hypothetical protein HBH91_031950 [Parastagonospora nodorum]KAH4517353.1 hypothetical protein HBH89_008740 [Parastagonospora nodorum]